MTEVLILLAYVALISVALGGVAAFALAVKTVLPLDRSEPVGRAAGHADWHLSRVLWALLMVGLLPLCIALLLRDGLPLISGLMAVLDLEIALRLVGARVEILSDATLSTGAGGGFPVLPGLLVVIFAGLTWGTRQHMSFVFFAFHLGLAALCFLLDLILHAPVEARLDTVERLLTACVWLVLVSQGCFALFSRPSARHFLLNAGSVMVSALALCCGAAVLAVLGARVDETGFMLISYLIVAYGMIAMHITGLTIAVSAATGRRAGAR